MKYVPLHWFLLLAFFLSSPLYGQIPQMDRPSNADIRVAPDWAQEMYAADPNVLEVDRLYKAWFRAQPFEKSYHTQYYKRWRRMVADHIAVDGHVDIPSPVEAQRLRQDYLAKRSTAAQRTAGSGWSVIGPVQVRNDNGDFRANQTNIYSISRCAADTNVLYAGTEPGEIYRSSDGGQNWTVLSDGLAHPGGLRAISADPVNPNIAYASSGSSVYKTTDGGGSWTTTYMANGFNANEILVHPADPSLVFIPANQGLWRSTDAGASWSTVFAEKAYDIKVNTGNDSILYLVKHNPSQNLCEFFLSTDRGQNWTQITNGWFTSTDPDRNDGGARLAVSNADPNRVYAYLIGEAKTGDTGYIGVYRSTDGGYSWTLPNGPPGGPYTTAHPNLAIGTTTWLYHQGFYNCALMASHSNADHILIGGLNLYRSTDGGATFNAVSGYVGGPLNMHVDNQDFRAYNGEYWISTDGGIYRSTDFFTTQPEVRMRGIHGSDYWGFGSGWNEDVVVGGLYHNGNLAWYQDYQPGDFLSLGGGEAPTGYVNPGDARKTYFSDIGGRYIPTAIGQPVSNLPFGLFPNESYWSAESSEVEWHPNCSSVAYLGRDHELWRSEDGGASFSLLHAFGSSTDNEVLYIEIASDDPDVIYVAQRPSLGNSGQLWRTVDGGQNWNQVSIPGNTNTRKILLQVDPEDWQRLFIAYPSGANGQKVYMTTDGGANWTNLTTAMLNGEGVHSIVHVPGTADGLYFCTGNTVYYKDNNLNDWVMYNTALPVTFNTNIARPFFRDGKIRIASYGKGIWEADFHTQPSRPIARPMADKLRAICSTDSFFFECHSFLNHGGATWAWDFPTGSPASSTLRNPVVAFNGLGMHAAILTVTDGNGQSATDTMYVEVAGIQAVQIAEDFEGSYPPQDWSVVATGNPVWTQYGQAGGFGNSASSVRCDNYNTPANGSFADLRAPINLASANSAWLFFDVAYAQYGGQYTDTLEVRISTDCGETWQLEYRDGGQSLATSPNQTVEFVPTASQWRTDSLDLSAYQGNGDVLVAFRNLGHYGNVIYLDNINLDGSPLIGLSADPIQGNVSLSPNPMVSGRSLQLRSDLDESFQVRVFNLEGKEIWRGEVRNGERFSLQAASGVYVWEAIGESLMKRGKLVVVDERK